MKERPILFSGAMVRALLDGSKTQTRRVVKPSRRYPFEFIGSGTKADPDWNDPSCWGFMSEDGDAWLLKDGTKESDVHQIPCPYGQPGDRLYVRETWASMHDAQSPRSCWYRADGEYPQVKKWTPSIHMPRDVSRILLEITGVRVERLNDCSEEDAIAEGIIPHVRGGWHWHRHDPSDPDDWYQFGYETARYAYEALWESINGAGSWKANPWVWVPEFKRVMP